MTLPVPGTTRSPARLLAVGLVLSAVVVALLAAAGASAGFLDVVVRTDEAVRRWAVASEQAVLVAVSQALAVLGGVWVTAPLRVVISLLLAWQRRVEALAIWLVSIAASEVVITELKLAYDRPRPPLSMEVTRSAAFPSGHTGAAAVTMVTLVLLFVPADAPRPMRIAAWGAAGAGMVLMAFSRVSLRVHWLSDVVVGLLIGAAVALLAAGTVGVVAAWWRRRGVATGA